MDDVDVGLAVGLEDGLDGEDFQDDEDAVQIVQVAFDIPSDLYGTLSYGTD